jgi:hypothetical protein
VSAWWARCRHRGELPAPVTEEVVVEAVIERPFPAPGSGMRAWPAWLLAGSDRLRARLVGVRARRRGLAARGRRVAEERSGPGAAGAGDD